MQQGIKWQFGNWPFRLCVGRWKALSMHENISRLEWMTANDYANRICADYYYYMDIYIARISNHSWLLKALTFSPGQWHSFTVRSFFQFNSLGSIQPASICGAQVRDHSMPHRVPIHSWVNWDTWSQQFVQHCWTLITDCSAYARVHVSTSQPLTWIRGIF